MSRNLRCPNCGGENALVNPGITMLVCHYCQTVVYWDDETALKTGSQSILPPSDARLFLHATGAILGRPFEVVGHLRYEHDRGGWDEWYVQHDDGGISWLSEDERELTLEEPVAPDPNLPPQEALAVGRSVSLEGSAFTVRELGVARCVGGEGQLPFTVLPGAQYLYADVASVDGTRFGTLEYDSGPLPHCFVGRTLGHDELTIRDERPPSTAGAHEGQHITCPNCAAPLEVPAGRTVETKVCEYCGAQNNLTGPQAVVLGMNPSGLEPGFQFVIGQAGTFRGARYEVCGRMLYEDDEGCATREYLLFNPGAGYLWLAEEDGHFVLNRPTQQAVPDDPFRMTAKQAVAIGPTSFRFYESGSSKLVYVDGALPWLARTGDSTRYSDLIAPPQMYGVETDGNEVEYFIGSYMSAPEVTRALALEQPLRRCVGVHPAQPFVRSFASTLLMLAGFIFALVNLGLLGWSLTQPGRTIFKQTLQPSEYLKETPSNPFVVNRGAVIGMSLHAPLDNSWLALDVALINEREQVVEEMDGEISYYHGYEDGESWSEGHKRSTSYRKAPPPGTYRLLLKAAAGSGETSPPRGEDLTIELSQGAVLSRYFAVALGLALLFPVFQVLRQLLFEQRRWAAVVGDDEVGSDDDDDDDDDDD